MGAAPRLALEVEHRWFGPWEIGTSSIGGVLRHSAGNFKCMFSCPMGFKESKRS